MTGSSSRSARAGLALLASLSLLAALPHRVAAAAYHVVARWTIGGEGGWDYLTADAATRRLYVTHNTQVEVLDLDSGRSSAPYRARSARTGWRSRRR